MSCSKEVRYPENWVKVQWEYHTKPEDETLLGLEELIEWLRDECCVTDEKTVLKYVKNIRPYKAMRAMCPIVPDNSVSRAAFKIFVHFLLGLFIVDDEMEKSCNQDDMIKIGNAFNQLDKILNEIFPKILSTKEMQPHLQYLSDKRASSFVTFFHDFPNRCARVLLQNGNISNDAIFDYKQRLTNVTSLYLQGLASAKREATKDALDQFLWMRLCDGLPIPFLQYVEVSSLSLGKVDQTHIAAATELYVLFALYCTIINDVYSYTRESNESLPVASLSMLWLKKKEISHISESVPKVIPLLDEIAKCVYTRVEKMKADNPNNSEVHELFDEISYGISGCYFLHHHASDRYKDSEVKFGIKGLEGNELEEWLAKRDPYASEVVKHFLLEHSTVAKHFNNVLCGVTPCYEDSFAKILFK